MRNISFALTTKQFLDGSKTVTRRNGWKNLKPGTRLMACRKCMGLKKGEKVEHLGPIEVTDVSREPLFRIMKRPGDCEKEGFPGLSPPEFILFYRRHNKCLSDKVITRIEFKRLT